jgi:hypothetical protein
MIMRRRLLLVAPVLLALATGCLKNNSSDDAATFPVPEGTFSGQFRAIRKNTLGKYDTLKTNVSLDIHKATGYTVTGGNTIHEDGAGNFAMDANYIQFKDAVYQGDGQQPKYHLTSVYRYGYDGTNFSFYRTSSDTLALVYDLKKN